MTTLQFVLFLLAALLIALEAIRVRAPGVHLGWLGLAIAVAALGILPAVS